MKRKIRNLNIKNYYRIFNRYADESERENYHGVKNANEADEIIKQFLGENNIDSIVHMKLFTDKPCKEDVITLIGTKQIMQISDSLYMTYLDEINNKLCEDMNYERNKVSICEDTEFILNLCSSGFVYNENDKSKIDKVYIYLMDRFGHQFISDLFKDVFGNSNDIIEVYHCDNGKLNLVCGDRVLLINQKMYTHISYDILQHNKRVQKNKILIKK